MPTCKHCHYEGTGKYCAQCAQPYAVKRITVHSIIHEVTHLFTHLDKGFLYTLKQLATRPGRMQKEYLEGHRAPHQKPFSLFFICATVSGFGIYWISKLAESSASLDDFEQTRIYFYRNYYVIMQAILIPFYAMVNWLLFRKKDFNYAEALILFIYSFSFLLLLIILTNTINLVSDTFETYYVEIPLLAVYITWTNLNFFHNQPRWLVIVKSIINLLICWLASNLITNQVIRWME